MLELSGKYNTAKIFTDEIEQTAISQIISMCNLSTFEGCKIRIMPDVHAGNDCVIGTTIKLKDKVVPNLVGGDIGCGMYVVKLKEKQQDLDLVAIDKYVTEVFPRSNDYISLAKKLTQELRCYKFLSQERIDSELGTIGGGKL